MKICIDPGHGGYDPGAVGPSGLREKDVTLAVALLLADLLRQAGCEVFLTRTGDTTSWTPEEDLQRRCDLANQAGADLFISIHANAAGNPAATGTETYCYRRGGQGERVAAAIQQQLVAALGLPDRGVKTASFYVLQHTAMAAVLAELALLQHKEPRKVSNDGYISHDGNLYPVPMRYCAGRVWIENIYGRRLKVYDEAGTLLAEFDLELQKQTVRPLHPEHETINRHYQEKKLKARSALAEKFTSAFGEDGQRYLAGLRDKNGANLYWHLAEILNYQEIYTREDIAIAIKECLKIGSYHKNSVKRLLEQMEVAPLAPAGDQINLNMPPVRIKRDLSCYAIPESEVAAVS
jgi:hypothetical protein